MSFTRHRTLTHFCFVLKLLKFALNNITCYHISYWYIVWPTMWIYDDREMSLRAYESFQRCTLYRNIKFICSTHYVLIKICGLNMKSNFEILKKAQYINFIHDLKVTSYQNSHYIYCTYNFQRNVLIQHVHIWYLKNRSTWAFDKISEYVYFH